MKSVFKSADMLGSGVQFNINGERNLTSNFGIILSFLIYLLILTAIIFFGKEIWEKDNPSVNLSYELDENPSGVTVDFKNFEFFFGIRNKENKFYVDNQIYTVKANLYSFAKNGTSSYFISRDLRIEPCHQGSFDEGSTMRKIDSAGGWCISRNQSFDLNQIKVKGLFGKDNFQMIRIFFYECKNSTINNLLGNTRDNLNNSNDRNLLYCKDKETIEQKLNSTTVTLNAIDNFVRPSNYINPTAQKIANYFFYVSKNSFSRITLFLKHLDFQSDAGMILSSTEIIKSFKHDYVLRDGTPTPDEYFASIFFQMSDISEKYFRKYYKIQDLFAQLGGLFKFFQLCAGIMMHRFNDFNFYSSLMKMVFFMDKDQKQRQRRPNHSFISEKFNLEFKDDFLSARKALKKYNRYNLNLDKNKEDNIKLNSERNKNCNPKITVRKEVENSKLEESENKLILQNNANNIVNLNNNEVLNINNKNNNITSTPINKNNVINHNSNNASNFNCGNSNRIDLINHRNCNEKENFSVFRNIKINKFKLKFKFWEKLFMSRSCIRKKKLSDFNTFLIGREILIEKLNIKSVFSDFLNMQKIKFLLLNKDQMACIDTLPKPCLKSETEYDKFIVNIGKNFNYEKLEEEKIKLLGNRKETKKLD